MDADQAIKELEKILAIQDPIQCADALMEVIDCSEDELYSQLPDPLKALVAINAFSLEHSGGGLYQVFANSSPELLGDIRRGLGLVGAKEAMRLVDAVRGKFPDGTIPEDAGARFELLDQLDRDSGGDAFRRWDQDYSATGEDVLVLLRSFVSVRKGEVASALASWRP